MGYQIRSLYLRELFCLRNKSICLLGEILLRLEKGAVGHGGGNVVIEYRILMKVR